MECTYRVLTEVFRSRYVIAMALPPSTANWHWKNKNVTKWGQDWLDRELTVVTVKGDSEGEVLSIKKINEFEGDVELGQRKSK